MKGGRGIQNVRKCEFVAGARRRANSVCVRLGVFMCEGEEEEGEEVRGRCAFVYGCADVRVRARAGVCSRLGAFAQRRTDMTGLSVVSPE